MRIVLNNNINNDLEVHFRVKSKQEEAEAPAPLTKDQELLTDIRELLRSKQK